MVNLFFGLAVSFLASVKSHLHTESAAMVDGKMTLAGMLGWETYRPSYTQHEIVKAEYTLTAVEGEGCTCSDCRLYSSQDQLLSLSCSGGVAAYSIPNLLALSSLVALFCVP